MPTYEITSPDGKTWEVTAPEGATQAQVLAYAKEQWSRQQEPGIADKIKQGAGDLIAGAVRGAGSIGATILAPVDAAARALNDGKPVNIGGYDIVGQDRRAGMDAGLRELGADTGSLAFQGGKLAAEVAGTMGAGGAAANVVGRAVPAAVAARAAPAIEALRTAGMSAGGVQGAGGLALRSAGGAVAGGLSAGLVDPADAETGALIGGAAPGVVQAAGKAGAAIARTLRGPMQAPEVAAAVKAARDAGYVIPPSQAKPTLANRLYEGAAGKLTTAQNASASNQRVTQGLAAKALGLPTDTPLTPDVLDAVRSAAGRAYDAVESAGTIAVSPAYGKALDKIAESAIKAQEGFPNAAESPVLKLVASLRSEAFDSSSAVAMMKQLRSGADDAFKSGNTDVGRAARAGAKAIEDEMERHLAATGQGQLLRNFRDARTLIAKTYTVQKAMSATGSIDARKLADALKKGKPLGGELRTAAEFADRFPKAAQPIEKMGSLPQTSPLDFYGAGGLAAFSGDPMALSALFVRPLMRSVALSQPVQNRLIQQGPGMLTRLPVDQAAQLGLRTAPVIGSSSSR